MPFRSSTPCERDARKPTSAHRVARIARLIAFGAAALTAFAATARGQTATPPDGPIELYDLARDPRESTDVAAAHPDIVARMREIRAARAASSIKEWNFGP